jgi:serine/threonine-protein kinase RsbW
VGGIQTQPRIELSLGNEPGATGKLRRAVDTLADRVGLAPEDRFDVKLAATEALTNAVKQAGDGRAVEVLLEGGDGVVEVQVADRGRFVEARGRHGFSEGGRGIPLMLALVDEVEFAQTGDGTRVRMRKRISRYQLDD